MLLRDYGPYIPQSWNFFQGQSFKDGPIGPSNRWYAQVPVSVSHLTNPVQHFTRPVECFSMDNPWHASPFLLLCFVLILHSGSGVRLCGLHVICLYPSGKVGAQVVFPLVNESHP